MGNVLFFIGKCSILLFLTAVRERERGEGPNLIRVHKDNRGSFDVFHIRWEFYSLWVVLSGGYNELKTSSYIEAAMNYTHCSSDMQMAYGGPLTLINSAITAPCSELANVTSVYQHQQTLCAHSRVNVSWGLRRSNSKMYNAAASLINRILMNRICVLPSADLNDEQCCECMKEQDDPGVNSCQGIWVQVSFAITNSSKQEKGHWIQ